MTIKPRKELCLIEQIEETFDSTLHIPDSRSRRYYLGRCIAIPDGRISETETKFIYAEEGKTYLFQIDQSTFVNRVATVKGKKFVFIHQADLLATIEGTVVNKETLSMAGRWILIEAKVDRPDDSLIVLPETASQAINDSVCHVVVGAGNQVSPEIKPGSIVYPTRSRVTLIQLDGVTYGYVNENDLCGIQVD